MHTKSRVGFEKKKENKMYFLGIFFLHSFYLEKCCFNIVQSDSWKNCCAMKGFSNKLRGKTELWSCKEKLLNRRNWCSLFLPVSESAFKRSCCNCLHSLRIAMFYTILWKAVVPRLDRNYWHVLRYHSEKCRIVLQ